MDLPVRPTPALLALAALLCLVCLGACSDLEPPGEPGSAPVAACPPGEVALEGGGCRPAGLPPDMPCPPGEWLRLDGRCQAAGIPADACGEGFVHDGDGGCEPILPAEGCPFGLMAIPGETACREVAPCGSGDYGDIPVDAGTQFVNGAYEGADSDGTQQRPWRTIAEGIEAADPGAIVAIAAGTYPENLDIEKAVRLWGRCPALVEITGTATATVIITSEEASTTEIRDLAVTGTSVGVAIWGAAGVLADRVWIHDTGHYGIQVSHIDAPVVGAMVSRSLIEQVTRIGVAVWGSLATVDSAVVRDIATATGDDFGVFSAPDSGRGSLVFLRQSVIERAARIGMAASSSYLLMESSVVRDTLMGPGVFLEQGEAGPPADAKIHGSLIERNATYGVQSMGSRVAVDATVLRDHAEVGLILAATGGSSAVGTLRRSLVEQNRYAGVFARGSHATIDGTLVRCQGAEGIVVDDDESTRGSATIQSSMIEEASRGMDILASDVVVDSTVIRDGRLKGSSRGGIVVQSVDDRTSSAAIRSSIIERVEGGGIFVLSSNASIESTVVHGTTPDDNGAGHGIEIITRLAGPRASAAIRSSLVEQNATGGIAVSAADVTIESVIVRDSLPNQLGLAGHGIAIAGDQPLNVIPSNATIRSSIIERSGEVGVIVLHSTVTLESSTVRDTAPNVEGQFGDGIAVVGNQLYGWVVRLSSVEIESSARAGVSNFGGTVDLDNTTIQCSAFDLEGSSLKGSPATYNDLGGNACGCPEAKGACEVLSAQLEPPEPPW